MPISAKTLDVGASLEQIRQEFNNLQSDVNILQQSPTYGESLIFEGATSDAYETTLSVQDPTADRTVLLPNETGTILLDSAVINATTSSITANNSTNETVYITFVDGATGNQGLESDTSLSYNPSTNLLTTGNIVVADAGNIGSASDTDAISISSGGAVQLSQSLTVAGTTTHTGTTTHNNDVTFTGDAANVVWDKSVDDLIFADNAKAAFGTGSDLTIYHDGSHSYIHDSGTGSLILRTNQFTVRNVANDENMIAGTADGAVQLSHDNSTKLATSSAGITVTGNIVISDAGNIGSASDTDAIAISSGGVVTFSQTPVFSSDLTLGDDLYLDSDGAVIHFGDDGDVTLTHVHDAGLRLPDGDKMIWGTGDDLQIFHDGSNSYIYDEGTGSLIVKSNQFIVRNAAGSENMFDATQDGAVNLYYDNSAKLTTASGGISVTGTATMSANVVIADAGTIGSASDTDAMTISAAGVVTFSQTPVLGSDLNLADDLFLDSDGSVIHFGDDGDVTLTHVADTGLRLEDSDKMLFGTGADFEIYHDGSNTRLHDTGTGNLLIQSNGSGVYIQKDASESLATFLTDGVVTLYHDNTAKIATSAAGVTVSGSILIADGGNIGSASDADSLAIDSSGNVTASQNLTVTGNLTVNGTTTTVSTSNTVIGDSLIELNSGAGSNSNDLGIVMERGSTGDNAIIAWDESADKFTLGTTTATGASTGNLSITAGTLVVSALEGTLSTAAQTNITSLGTLTALTVDNVSINGTTIGHTGDTDLMTLASGVLTVAGRVDVSDDIYLTGDEKAIRFYNGSNYVTLQAHGSLSSNVAFKLPQADGSAGQAMVTDASGNLSFAANNIGNATSFTTVANNSTDETTFVVFVDGATGEQGPETDTGLTYNPSTGLLSTAAITLTGALTVGGTTTLNGNLVLGDAAADTLTVGATLQGASPLTFEGGTADGNETTFAITDPTADRTITFPDATGTVVLSGGTLSGSTITATTAFVPDASDGAALGTSSLEFSDLFLADGAVINFGDDQDVTLTHVADTGLLLNSTREIQFRDSALKIYSSADGQLDLAADTEIELTSTTVAVEGIFNVSGTSWLYNDVYHPHDGVVLHFGADHDVVLTHVHDTGLRLSDGDKLLMGNSDDLSIYHDGNNSALTHSGTGDFYIQSDQFYFRSSTGGANMITATVSGAVALMFNGNQHFTTNSGGGALTGNWSVTDSFNPDASDGATLGTTSLEWSDLYLADSAVIYFGADQDVELHHIADTGLRLPDNDKFQLGADGDLSLFHDGSNSYIHDSGAGALYLATSLFHVTNNNATESIIYAAENGGVNLYYDNSKKLETFTDSVRIAGYMAPLTAAGGALGSTALEWSGLYLSDNAAIHFGNDQDVVLTHVPDSGIRLSDSDKLLFGAGDDLQIYHSGTHSLIQDAGTGNLYIDSQSLWLRNYSDSASMAVLTGGGAVQLFHDGSEKFTTISTGISVTGGIVSSDNVHMRHDGVRLHFGVNDDVYMEHIHDVGVRMPDNDKFQLGTDGDLSIYHDGSHSHVQDTGTGNLYLSGSIVTIANAAESENIAHFNENGGCHLYFDNSKKLETVTGGVNVTGGMTITDNVHLDHDGVILHFGDDNDITLTHDHDVGLALNAGSTIYRTGAGQYDAAFTVREGTAGKAHVEFGHSNTAGYGSVLGTNNGGGQPYISFYSGPGTNNNTFQTHGVRGNGIYANSGSLIIYDVTTADADNQTATTRITLDTTAGNITTSGTVTATAGATLLVKNSSGTTLKTIKGMS